MYLLLTVWKFHIFAATQILREIKSKDFRSSKIAILTLLEALNLDFSDLMLFARGKITILKIQSLFTLKLQK